MTKIRVGTDEYDIDGVVFDKDGLLFDSLHFWKGLGDIRIATLAEIDRFPIEEWCRLFGVRLEDGKVADIDPNGIFAIASPQEEATVTAALLHDATGSEWGWCRNQAAAAFRRSDERFDVRKVLHPKPGFPDIFRRLREAGIPYGIATSDDAERTRISVDVYDRADDLSFIITPVDVKKGKPSPDMLHLASDILGVPTGRLLMLGDSYVDVQMAHEAGSIGIGIPDDGGMETKMRPYASKIISSLEEIEF
ncbi:HAD family hydrolase [Cohnella mopanensis]|uniref:HAD family hydrolase n=1 Tax=Cohnella mopanensis TaxID=2911966 RepID=UPI001EF89FA4|nr:HAD family hydrolase [Cohnella mopanensis]